MAAAASLAILTTHLYAADLGLKLPPGFEVTLYADHELANDIYAMTLDDEGRVIVTSRGWVKRLIDTDGDGKADKAELLLNTPTGGMGLYCADDILYICADGEFKAYHIEAGQPSKSAFHSVAKLAFTEHGGHAMRKGPDGRFYLIYGNSAAIERVALDPTSPIKKPEAGGILRFSRDLKKIEVVAQGFRNPYRFDFTPLGDIITYDSDTERDYLLPWYSPTRMYHVAHAMHHGWRLPGYLQSLARRDYYADTVDILASMGRGSPTGVVCYRHHQFPKHYQGGVFALDWTFGKVYFLPLEVDGATYKTKPEVFVEPNGINGFAPTDACVAPDGSLFICIGGRGTRGAVYRIEYVGTKETPRGASPEPANDLDLILDAPQPLDAWSRKKWEAIVESEAAFDKVIVDEKESIARRVRAIEIRNDRFDGLSNEVAQNAALSRVWQVRSRVAWSLGRDIPAGGEEIVLKLAQDEHPKVRVNALDALGDLLDQHLIDKEKQISLIPIIIANLGHADKRVRMSASRVMTILDPKIGARLSHSVNTASLRTRLTYAIADHSPGILWLSNLKIDLEAISSNDPALRLDALRLLMLIDGDWCLHDPPAVVYSAYALQNPRNKPYEIEQAIRQRIRDLFPTGDQRFNTEASRYFAMIEDDDPATVVKILNRITKESQATEDVHHLIVLSRLKAKRPPEQTPIVADALLGLEKKLQGQQLRIKQTWGSRLTEVVASLIKEHSDLPDVMLKNPDFVNPAHVVFTEPFDIEHRKKAARLFLERVKSDGEFAWSEDLVNLLAVLPAKECRPIFRTKWGDYSLREGILKVLVVDPEADDRMRFLDGLDSPAKSTVLACIAALEMLPKDPSAKALVPILRRLRLSLQDPKEKDMRDRLLALFNRQAGTNFIVKEETKDPLKLKKAYAPIFELFEMKHPEEARLLRGDEEDASSWKKQYAAIPWEKGDAERGFKIFRERSCMTCHTGSSRIGPDLMGVVGRFSREDLFDAIVYPNRDVAPAYRVNEIETRDGKQFSGIVVFESADGVIVQTGANSTVRIDNSNLASRQPSTKSMMPGGLLKDLKPLDLADLYSYLKSLKAEAKGP